MWPLISIVLEKQALFCSFNTHLWGFQGDRWETFILRIHLGMWPIKSIVSEKNKPCSEGFQGDRWENVHFESKAKHVTLKLIVLKNQALFWGFQHIFMGFPSR